MFKTQRFVKLRITFANLILRQTLATFILTIVIGFSGLVPSVGWTTADQNPFAAQKIDEQNVHPKFKDTLNWVLSLDTIRIGVMPAPGNGHQSASAAILRRLQQLGFSGRIEVIYDQKERTRASMKLVFPDFDTEKGDDFTTQDGKIRFISYYSFKSKEQPTVDLALIGGADQKYSPQDLKAESLIIVQPFRWYDAPEFKLIHSKTTHVRDKFIDFGLEFVSANWESNREEIIASMKKNGLKEKWLGLNKIISLQNRIGITPIYGFGAETAFPILRYATVLAHMLKTQQSTTPFRRPVLLLFNKIDTEALQEVFNSTQSFQNLFSLPEKIPVISVTDFDRLNAELEKDTQLPLIVNVGPVSSLAFEAIYKMAFYPPVVEGQNSIHLMSTFGKPFFPSHDEEVYSFTAEQIEAADIKTQKQLAISESWLYSKNHYFDFTNPDFLDEMATLLRDAIQSQSPLSRFFAMNSSPVQDMKKDKIMVMLRELYQFKNRQSVHPLIGARRPKISNGTAETLSAKLREKCNVILSKLGL